MVLLFCTYVFDTYVLSVCETDSFKFIVDKICRRWPSLNSLSLRLFYKLPGCSRCFLSGDEVLVTMFVVSQSLNGNGIHVDVLDESNAPSSSSSRVLRDVDDVVSSSSSTCITPFDSVDDEDSLFMLMKAATIKLGWDKISFKQGTVFYGGVSQFRLSLQKVSIDTGFQYVLKKNDGNRITAYCPFKDQYKCLWHVHGVKLNVNGYFYVKKSCIIHVCGSAGRSFHGTRISSDLVAEVIESMVCDTPNLRACVVKRDLFSLFKFKVTYFRARIGVSKAKSALYGDVRESFKRLPSYVQCLLDSNPGSRVFYEVDPGSCRFRRLFVAFDCCIRGFNSCRPLLFLDGAHLKGQFRGHLLAATGKDGNQGIYPLCFAVVDSEDTCNWEWFLIHLKSILDPMRPITFISDRNSGLIDGVRTVFPNAYHSYCLYHLKLNLRVKCSEYSKSKFFCERMVALLDRCGYASTELEFDSNMQLMLVEGGNAVKDFFTNPNHANWANVHFKGSRYGYITSSTAESFNSWVLTERHLPVVNLVDAIRIKLMKRFTEKRTLAASFSTAICPAIDVILSHMMDQSKEWNVERNGYPCRHGVAAVMSTRLFLHDYVDVWYRTSSFLDSYQYALYPVQDTYLKAHISAAVPVLPPLSRRQPRRPRTKRFASRGESSQRSKRAYRCSRCGSSSRHNKRTCSAAMQLD